MRSLRFFCLVLFSAAGMAARQADVTILATTDLHGHIYPYDYYTSRPADWGLAKIATLVNEVRKEDPHSLLIDCGDTIQGSPLEAVYQYSVWHGRLPSGLANGPGAVDRDPMMVVMNHLGYDAMVLGNHEFNFGLKNLFQARKEARFPWLSANTMATEGQAERFEPYIVRSVNGVNVAIIGITTPAIPQWEKPENYVGFRFDGGVEAARRVVGELKRKIQPDLIVVAVHAGLDRDGKVARTGRENMVHDLATQVAGIDAIVFGHTHQQLAELRIGNVLLCQPRNWGGSLARLDFRMESAPDGAWRVAAKKSRLIPVTRETPADAEVLRLARPYHELTERYLDMPVAHNPAEMDARVSRVRDTAVVDAIHAVQLHYTGADVSFTSSFNARARIAKGPVTVRQLASIYVYENELYCIEGTGLMVREAIENAARYFLSCRDAPCAEGPLINPEVFGYNYDMAEGVEYEVDLRRPQGQRVRNLRWRGQPLADDQELRIAVNNYRAAGSAGYGMFRDARILWRSAEGVRELMVEYYMTRGTLPAVADGNWRIVPPEAAARLEREAR